MLPSVQSSVGFHPLCALGCAFSFSLVSVAMRHVLSDRARFQIVLNDGNLLLKSHYHGGTACRISLLPSLLTILPHLCVCILHLSQLHPQRSPPPILAFFVTILPKFYTCPHCIHSQPHTTPDPSPPDLSQKVTELLKLVKVLVTESGAASRAELAAQQVLCAQHVQQELMVEVQRQLQQGQGLLMEQLQAQAQQHEQQQQQLKVMDFMR